MFPCGVKCPARDETRKLTYWNGLKTIMNDSTPTYEGSERRRRVRLKKSTAELHAELEEIAEKVGDHPNLTGDDMRMLYLLMRDFYRRGLEGRSFDMLQIVREEHADEFSPALLALVEDVLSDS